jgi:anti-sigma regulatory factor (Ser/Thr protein kinase)
MTGRTRMAHDEKRPAGYRHVGHVRPADGDVTAVVASFVDRVSAAGDRLAIACPEPMASELAAAFDDVHVLRPEPFDTRPAAGVAELLRLVDQEMPGDGSRLQLVIAVQHPESGWAGWMQTEALLNHVLADRPVDHLCLLGPETDVADGLGPADASIPTHPWVMADGELADNPGYREPAQVVAELQHSRVPDPMESTEPALALLDLDDMRWLRRAVTRVLADSPLTEDAAQDFVLAIDEIVANAAEHGVPPVDVRLWCGQDRLLCSITDHGVCFDDPLAGYGPAHGDMAVGGMGLWLARRSVDELVAAPAEESGGGCIVRLVVNA